MKSGTDSKLKFKQLQRALDLPLWQARGLLDTLWDFAVNNCPAGNIGRFTDDEIATGIDWRGDATKLIETLVSVRWLDRHETHRIIVHDWPEHCEDRVKTALAKAGELFADGSIPSMTRMTIKDRKKAVAKYRVKYGHEAVENGRISEHAQERSETQENAYLTLPNLTLPNPPPPLRADDSGEGEASWKLVLKELKAAGVNDAAAAVKDAKAHGLTPQHVLDLIAHFRTSPGAWEAGALYFRVRNGSPESASAEGWPPPAKAHVEKAKEREATAARQKEQADQQRVASATREADSKLEKDFGERLDSMDDAAVLKLLNGHTLIIDRLKKHGRKSKLVRDALLRELASREGFSQ